MLLNISLPFSSLNWVSAWAGCLSVLLPSKTRESPKQKPLTNRFPLLIMSITEVRIGSALARGEAVWEPEELSQGFLQGVCPPARSPATRTLPNPNPTESVSLLAAASKKL